jgi:hypothetical protein
MSSGSIRCFGSVHSYIDTSLGATFVLLPTVQRMDLSATYERGIDLTDWPWPSMLALGLLRSFLWHRRQVEDRMEITPREFSIHCTLGETKHLGAEKMWNRRFSAGGISVVIRDIYTGTNVNVFRCWLQPSFISAEIPEWVILCVHPGYSFFP